MKTIGLIGGMSWESSIEYYRAINQLVAGKLGGLHSARVYLYSLDFAEIERIQREDRWDDATLILIQAGMALKQGGADFILICTNTMHKVADIVAQKVGLPVVSIIDVTGNAIIEHGLRTVGLLGTRFVMEETFYRDRLHKGFGINVIVPPEAERNVIHNIIYEELCRGKILEASHQACIEIIKRMKSNGAEGVILGCTELPLLVHSRDVDIPLFDTSRLHSEAAVNLALAG
jgi:aspartate racemase